MAGGAETFTHEVLSRAVARGHECTWVGAAFPGGRAAEEVNGIRIVRFGRQWNVHLHAARWWRRSRGAFDVTIDQVNTLPFLTPLYVPEPQRRLLIFQTAREYWWRQTRGAFRLIAPAGYVLEPQYLKAYRGTRALTISGSTRDELMGLGLPADRITVMPMAASATAVSELPSKPRGWRIVVVGRLTAAKHVEDAIDGFALLRRDVPDAELLVIGEGEPTYRRALEARVAAAGLTAAVRFAGRVSEQEKLDALRDAHAHVFCSRREGWGITVTEAAGRGTPTVGFDVPGVRDSIADARLIVPVADGAAGIAERLRRMAVDRELHDAVRRDAWEQARHMSFDRTTDAFLEALE